jgi:hypothetical protein
VRYAHDDIVRRIVRAIEVVGDGIHAIVAVLLGASVAGRRETARDG